MLELPYYCLNCNSVMELDKHLRCGVCGSDSVDIAVRPPKTPESTHVSLWLDAELERLWRQS